MAWNPANPANDELLINFPAQCRANWEAIVLGTDPDLLITNAKCSPSMGLVDTKLAQIVTPGKVSGAAITLLGNVPSGAGVLPDVNSPNKLKADSADTTPQYLDNLIDGDVFQVSAGDLLQLKDGGVLTEKLAGGAASPGNLKYYGTDEGGAKGFHSLPAGLKHAILTGYIVKNNGTDAAHDLDIYPGLMYHGATAIEKTAITTLQTDNNAHWISGAQPGSLNNIFVHVYVNSTGTFKFDTNAPNRDDDIGSNVTGAVKYYYYDGATYWRHVFSTSTNESGALRAFINFGRWIYLKDPVRVCDTTPGDTWTDLPLGTLTDPPAPVSGLKVVPPTSKMVQVGLLYYQGGYSSGPVSLRPKGATDWQTEGEQFMHYSHYAPSTYGSGLRTNIMTDENQKLEYKTSSVSTIYIAVLGYELETR
ncbi:MAG: hypothetical protein Q8R48_02395 [Candidatus Omnitrophota bacterium]|nr:hypothetical protein [Candidatus Omnitrophota bacterium]